MATPTDPLYDDQWHFDLIGDIETIWDDYDGTGVSVGVYDDGFQYDHEDLDDNYDASLHFSYDGVTYDPYPTAAIDGHGTSCAGLIGAEADNGVGGTGVASGVSLTGVNYLSDIQFQDQEVIDEAMYWAANFDIMSNSWGYSLNFSPIQNLSTPTSDAALTMGIWAEVSATGRDGLGTVILKAAGNEDWNANGDGYNASRITISVAATDEFGDATYYTNYGACILVAAPASAVTTDLSGEFGYNRSGDGDPLPDLDYTSDFGGTSAATPTTAGVVALMLEAAPGLGWRDVQNILALSASHTGADFGAAAEEHEIGTWNTTNSGTWNGGGTQFHTSYGYGMVDAYTAVRFSEAWGVIYADEGAQTSANEVTASASYSGSPVAIPDGTGAQAAISMTASDEIMVEHVAVEITLTHQNMKNLDIWLEAPDGTLIQIGFAGDSSARFADDGKTWIYGVDGLRGYSSDGEWSVIFEDTVTGESGTISDVELTFYGSAWSSDTVFHFTDDYAMHLDVDDDRGLIDDVDGGTDWLNLAAVAQDVTVSLVAGNVMRFDGVLMADLAAGADEIENAYMGDGDDTVNGNLLGNEVWGARGADSIQGRAGDDLLSGNSGDDTIKGGAGIDMIDGGSGNDLMLGNGSVDYFEFGTGFGTDELRAFSTSRDMIMLDDALWGGGSMTAAEVLADFAVVSGADVIFDFGGSNIILVDGAGSTAALLDNIIVV